MPHGIGVFGCSFLGRMESSGVPGEIHITEDSYDLIKDQYIFEQREPIEIKGKGLMQTYFVVEKMVPND